MAETDHTLPAERAGESRDDHDVLTRNLVSRLSFLGLYQAAIPMLLEIDAQEFVRTLIDEEQEALALLAGRLRRLGYPVPTEASPERLLNQFRARRGTLDQLAFLRRGIEGAAEWYEGQAGGDALAPATRELFAELGRLQRERIARLDVAVIKLRG